MIIYVIEYISECIRPEYSRSVAETLSLRTALIFLGSRCSDGASNRYPRQQTQLLIVLVTSVYHWNLAKPVDCFCFSIWNRVTEILLGFPVESLDHSLFDGTCHSRSPKFT